MRYNIFFLLIFFVTLYSSAQENIKCKYLLSENNGGIKITDEEIKAQEISLKQFCKNNFQLNVIHSILTIPVIVHVLYNQPSENVPDSQIIKMIQILNEDFGRYNPDANNTPVDFLPVASATNIQFCLVTKDTLGNPSLGINHVNTPTIQFADPFMLRDPSAGGISAWNTDKYFNIWVGNANGFNGASSFSIPIYPAYHSGYGLVADYNYVNNIQLGDTSFYSGRGITHNVGHCFNLYDVYGNNGCMDNDSVSDTPPQLNPTIGCPVFPVTDSCTQNYPGIMFMNFMDYSDETCINMFTIEQGIRMYNSLLFYYPQLTATSPCLPLDISENETIHSIQIYPNPSSGLFKVLLNTKQKLKKIIACNILGEIINLNIQEEVPNYSIDASEIISGIYFLKLDFENWSVVKKFIKN